jgi:hypothetical protein
MKFPTLVPVILRCTYLINIPAGFKRRPSRDIPRKVEAAPNSRATHLLKGTGHSRTLYTSNALDQSNIII